MENKLWSLLARKFAGEASLEELDQLQRLLESDPATTDMVKKIETAWSTPGSTELQKALAALSRVDAKIMQSRNDSAGNDAAGNISAAVPEEPRVVPFKKRIYLFLKLAACILLLWGAWAIAFRQGTNEPPSTETALREFKAPARNIRQVQLPDGTSVYLNENSHIRFGEEFNGEKREVWLVGEAYFDVVKNKEKPFLIHAGRINIKVLGTAFNVKSYPDDKNIETSLIRGSVEVTLKDDPAARYILKPHQKLTVSTEKAPEAGTAGEQKEDNPGISFTALNAIPDGPEGNIIAELSWKERKLAFYESSFSELAGQLEKRFGVSFVFENKELENLVFTGVFNKETLTQALHALSISAPFRYRIEAHTVLIFK